LVDRGPVRAKPDRRFRKPVVSVVCRCDCAPLWQSGSRVDFLFQIPLFPMSYPNNGFHAPAEDEIAVCAYLIWEKEGRPVGREREHWDQAEAQLLACRLHEEWVSEEAEKRVRD